MRSCLNGFGRSFPRSTSRSCIPLIRDPVQVNSSANQLLLVVGLPGSILMGLCSIIGAGVFVSLGLDEQISGSTVLLAFVLLGATALRTNGELMQTFFNSNRVPELFEATALMFVAYTGYGRIATLGGQVREPRRTIRNRAWVNKRTDVFKFVQPEVP